MLSVSLLKIDDNLSITKMIKNRLPIKLELKQSPWHHLAKIIRGIIGQIPVIGPIAIEYISIQKHDEAMEVKEGGFKYAEEWYSEDEALDFTVRENGLYEQHGQLELRSFVSFITFPKEFRDTKYSFVYDPQETKLKILRKESYGLELEIFDFPKVKHIRWFARGFI